MSSFDARKYSEKLHEAALQQIQEAKCRSAGSDIQVGVGGLGSALTPVASTGLSSLTVRVINLALTISQYSQGLESAFGIAQPIPESKSQEAPTLLNQLQLIEDRLRLSAYALENVLNHVNG